MNVALARSHSCDTLSHYPDDCRTIHCRCVPGILCVKGGMMARRVAAVENQATAEALKKLIEKCGGRFIGVTPHPTGGDALNVHYDSDNEIDFGCPPSDEDKYN
jgi:hypothetical protein